VMECVSTRNTKTKPIQTNVFEKIK
jgi:hypothetical protein